MATVEQVHEAPDVFRIRVPFKNISTSATNCYVVRDGGEALVVDTGAPTAEGARVLSDALNDLGVDRQRATWFLTHFHLDHAGLVDRVVPQGADVCMSAVDCGYVRVSRTAAFLESLQREFQQQGLPFHDASAYARLGAEHPLFDSARVHSRFVREGDTLDVGRFTFRVLEVPGHTPGHLALFDPASRIIFSGDHVLFVISPSIALFPYGKDGLQAYLDSLQKVRAMGVSHLFHSHGPIRPDFNERIDWLSQHHRDRLAEMCAIVQDAPGTTGYEALRRIKWNVPFERWDDISFLQRSCIVTEGIVYLNHLVKHGILNRELDEGGELRYRVAVH